MPADSIEILFVCTGNTCRSPMAEGLFHEASKSRALTYKIKSAGVAASNGTPASANTQTVLKTRSISLDSFTSQLVSEQLLASAHYVFCMSERHRATILSHHPEYYEKIFLVGEFLDQQNPVEIVDPFGMDLAAYEEVAAQLTHALTPIFDTIEEGHGIQNAE